MQAHATEASFVDFWDNELTNALTLGDDGPGGSVHITRDDHTIFSSGYGMASVANHQPFTPDTPSGIRSVSKAITASLALQAEQDSWVNWGRTPFPGGVIHRNIGQFPVVHNNIRRWENRFIPAECRTPGAMHCRPPVHTDCTLTDIVCHNAHIWPIGRYTDQTTHDIRPLYNSMLPHWETGAWENYDSADNLIAAKHMMETLESVDDIVAMAGAVQSGVLNFANAPRSAHRYYLDKAGWLTAAITESLLGNSWYNLVQLQFDYFELQNSYPSCDGNALFTRRNGEWTSYFQGHNSNPIEIPGLAAAYTAGPVTETNPEGLYLEPEQSQESGYAIGSCIMSAKDLARWGESISRSGSPDDLLMPRCIDTLFSTQTGEEDALPSNMNWPGTNWGFGIEKMLPVYNSDGLEIEVWGSIGQGGYGGYGAAIIWLRDYNIVIAVNTNSFRYGYVSQRGGGIDVRTAYALAEDYAANFL